MYSPPPLIAVDRLKEQVNYLIQRNQLIETELVDVKQQNMMLFAHLQEPRSAIEAVLQHVAAGNQAAASPPTFSTDFLHALASEAVTLFQEGLH